MAERYMYRINTKLKTGMRDAKGNPEYKKVSILLDTIEDTTVTLDSTITTHPSFDGQSIADHMYRNPSSVSISGTFAAYTTVLAGGSMTDYNTNTKQAMQYLQSLFEQIKDDAAVCSLAKIVKDGSKTAVRFKIRPQMVLQSIDWTEKITTLSYTFKFSEIMTAKIQEYSVDTTDSFLPGIDVLQTISFTQEAMNWNYIDALIFSASLESGWLSKDFANYLVSEQGSAMYVVAAGALAGGAAGIGIGVITALGLTPGPGWVILALVGVGFLGYGLFKIIQGSINAKLYAEEQLKLSKDDSENQKNVEKYANFVGNIHKSLLALDDVVTVYSVTLSNRCQFYVNFENNYYLCKLEQNLDYYSFSFCDIEGNKLGKQISNISTVPLDLFECSPDACIYRLPLTGSYVYLINKCNYQRGYEDGYRISQGDIGAVFGSETYYNADTNNFIKRYRTDSYYIVASKLAPTQFENTIKSIVLDAIMR